MTASARTKTFENLKLQNCRLISVKLAQYMYHLNTFHLPKTEGVSQIKDMEFIKILTLISLKNSLQNAVRLGISPCF